MYCGTGCWCCLCIVPSHALQFNMPLPSTRSTDDASDGALVSQVMIPGRLEEVGVMYKVKSARKVEDRWKLIPYSAFVETPRIRLRDLQEELRPKELEELHHTDEAWDRFKDPATNQTIGEPYVHNSITS